MPYGQDPPVEPSGYGKDPTAAPDMATLRTTAQEVAASLDPEQREELRQSIGTETPTPSGLGAQAAFALKVQDAFGRKQDSFDQAQEAAYLAQAAALSDVPAPRLAKARQLWIVKPQYDFSYIVDNLDKIEREAQADNIPFDLIVRRHPVLAKYLKDSSTFAQSLQDSASLTGLQNVWGGFAPIIQPDGTMDKKYVLPFWAQEAWDAITNNPSTALANFGYAVVNSNVKLNEFLRKIGVPEKILISREAQVADLQRWDNAARVYGKAATWAKDYRGHFDEDNADVAAKIARTAGWLTEAFASSADMLVGMGLGGTIAKAVGGATRAGAAVNAYTRGVLGFNTAYAAMDLYPKTLAASEDPLAALALTAVGALLVGKLMLGAPLGRAVGVRVEPLLANAVARSATEALASRNGFALARTLVLKGGWDALAGQIAMGLQAATSAEAEQLGLAWANKPRDASAGLRAFWHGATNPDGVPLSLFGTAHMLVSDVGKMWRARQMVDSTERIRSALLESKIAVDDPALHEQQVREMAAQPGADPFFHLPLDRFNEVVEALKLKPRDVASEIYGDGGAVYDRATTEGAAHLVIPIEKMRRVFESKHLGDFAMNEGTLNPEVISRAVMAQVTADYKKAFDEALKLDPTKLLPTEKPIYDALLAFAESDPEAAKRLFAETKALASRHPTLTLTEIYDATFGPSGLYGPQPKYPVSTEIGQYKNEGPTHDMHLIFTHEILPEKLHIELDENISTGGKVWVSANFDFPQEMVERYGYVKLKEIYGGKGHATDIYLTAMKEAQKAGAGWVSHLARTDVTEEMYARLKSFGIAFRLETKGPFGDHYYISANDLKAVDFRAVERRRLALLAQEHPEAVKERLAEAYGMPAPVEQAMRLIERESGLFGAERWKALTDDPKVQADFETKELEVRRLARERVMQAIMEGPKREVLRMRAEYEAKAEEVMAQDPGQRLRHFFQTGELLGDASHRLFMIDPTTDKPLRVLESEVKTLGYNPEEFPKGSLTRDEAKSIPAHMVASALSYPGSTDVAARQMLVDLRDALPKQQFVKEYADLQLREALTSDLLVNPQALMTQIMDAVHNEKVFPAILSRLRAMGQQLDPLRQARSAMTPEMWEGFANQILLDKSLSRLRPESFARSAKLASGRALKALEEGKIDKAFDATEAQLLNHYLYRAARELAGSLGSTYTKLSERATSDAWRTRLGKADPSYRVFHDALLSAVGLAETTHVEGALQGFLDRVERNGQSENLAANLPGGWDAEVVGRLLDGSRTWKDLTAPEARQVFNAIMNVQHLAKEQGEAMKFLRDADRQTLITDAKRNLAGLKPEEIGPVIAPLYPTMQDTTFSKMSPVREVAHKVSLQFGWNGAYLDSPRVILGYLGDLVKDRVYGGFNDARIREAELLQKLFLPWKETQKIFENDPDFYKPLPGLEDKLRIEGLDGPLTKKYLIQIVKWIGSASGREKALKGLGVNLDTVLEAVGTYLKPYEVEAIQTEHKFFEDHLLPLKSETWERRTGLPFAKVEALPYEIKFTDGTTRRYAGGYYPIHWETRPGVAKHARPVSLDLAPTLFPKVPDGSFQERTKYVGTPDFNWNTIPAHLLGDIHNIAFGDFVQEANRVLLDPGMLSNVRDYLGETYAQWPRAWLTRVAHESRGSIPEHLSAINAAGRWARSGLITGALGFNLPLFAGDMVHPLATATMRDGIAMAATYAGPSMKRVMEGEVAGLVTGTNPLHAEIISKSRIVWLREQELPANMLRWFHGTYSGGAEPGFLETAERVRDAISNTAFWHLRQSDRMVTDMIWDAKYRKTLDMTGDEMQARKEADDQVLAAMPDYSVMAVPTILAEKHGFGAAAMLVFHSYWSKLLEMADEQRHVLISPQKTGLSKAMAASQWGGRVIGMFTFAVVGGDFLQGRSKQDDEDWQTWLLRKELAAPGKLFPFVAALSEPAIDALVRDTKARDVFLDNPYFATTERALRAINSSLTDERKEMADNAFDLARGALMFSGLPATAPIRSMQYLYKIGTGEEQPRGLLDAAHGIGYGKKYGRSERYNEMGPLRLMQETKSIAEGE